MNVAARFQSYLASLELTPRERKAASDQQVALRDRLRLHLEGVLDIRLVGSYRRGTAIRPLKDIDVFVVLDAGTHRRDAPDPLLQTIKRALRAGYPDHDPRIQNRSVNIEFSGTEIAYDIVAAFPSAWTGAADTEPPYYEIPDRRAATWIRTNPAKHGEACIAANKRAGDMLNGLIKAAKHWNRDNGKPLSGFHIEVMSYEAFGWKPDDPRAGLWGLFQHLASKVQSSCPDPAGLGPAIDADLTWEDRVRARDLLQRAAQVAQAAVDAERKGDDATANAQWHSLLGDAFR